MGSDSGSDEQCEWNGKVKGESGVIDGNVTTGRNKSILMPDTISVVAPPEQSPAGIVVDSVRYKVNTRPRQVFFTKLALSQSWSSQIDH